ncbi:hypothetical protein RR46_06632 [Papilio xuthus]|uniref:Cuticular protein n=1 Tax=Papilio xuthus TaxID=66420 RepID=A0A194PL73_PAPXU|nr:hypothetical protein RR46_06632 [Papilio xuthus]
MSFFNLPHLSKEIAVILCLFGLARGGNLSGGLGLGQHGLGYGSNLGLRSGLGYGTSLGQGFGIGYGSNLGIGSKLGYGTNNLGYGNGWQDYGSGSYGYGGYGYGSAGLSRPATSTVSIKKYSGPAVPYSTGFGGYGGYGSDSNGYGYGGLGAYGGNAGYGRTGLTGPATSTVSIKKYSGPAVPYSTGFGGPGAHGLGSQGYGYNGLGSYNGYGGIAGYGNTGLAGAAVSSVSIKKYLGPDVPYSSGFGRHGAYDALGQGYGSSGYAAGGYGNKW